MSGPRWEGVETEHVIDDLVTAIDGAHLLGIDPRTIRQWASRGTVEKHTAQDGSPRYLLRELVDREHATRRTRATRQR